MIYKIKPLFNVKKHEVKCVVHPAVIDSYCRKIGIRSTFELSSGMYMLVVQELPRTDSVLDSVSNVRRDIPFVQKISLNTIINNASCHVAKAAYYPEKPSFNDSEPMFAAVSIAKQVGGTEGRSFNDNVGASINYHGIENGVDRQYNQLDPTNPTDWKLLDDEGFITNGVIDEAFMEEEGDGAPKIEQTIPARLAQTADKTVNDLVRRAKGGITTAADTEVTLWRGTTGVKAELIAKNRTAGGGDFIGEDVGAPTKKEAALQAQHGNLFPEYSTDPSVTDRFSREHYAVVIKIKARYLTRGSGNNHESGWIAYENAPVIVEYILDRTYGRPENIHTINAS